MNKRKGTTCSFSGCTANKRDNPDRVFFFFPSKNLDICRQWVLNCGKKELQNLSNSQLSSRRVCNRHFKRSCFPNHLMKRLYKDSIPTVCDNSATTAISLPTMDDPSESEIVTASKSTTTKTIFQTTPCPAGVIDSLQTGETNSQETKATPSATYDIPGFKGCHDDMLLAAPSTSGSGVPKVCSENPAPSPNVGQSSGKFHGEQKMAEVSLNSTQKYYQKLSSPVTEPNSHLPSGDDDSVSVKWNSYAKNMSSVLPGLLEDGKFVDVTLACEGKYIKCHKLILGASSPYFEELLSTNPCQHPIILMKDFQFWQIQAIVDFIYRGVVCIPWYQLPKFLEVAGILQIKDFTGPVKDTSSSDDDAKITICNLVTERVQSEEAMKRPDCTNSKGRKRPNCIADATPEKKLKTYARKAIRTTSERSELTMLDKFLPDLSLYKLGYRDVLHNNVQDESSTAGSLKPSNLPHSNTELKWQGKETKPVKKSEREKMLARERTRRMRAKLSEEGLEKKRQYDRDRYQKLKQKKKTEKHKLNE